MLRTLSRIPASSHPLPHTYVSRGHGATARATRVEQLARPPRWRTDGGDGSCLSRMNNATDGPNRLPRFRGIRYMATGINGLVGECVCGRERERNVEERRVWVTGDNARAGQITCASHLPDACGTERESL